MDVTGFSDGCKMYIIRIIDAQLHLHELSNIFARNVFFFSIESSESSGWKLF